MAIDTQLGVVAEVTYGTPVAPVTRFFPLLNESIREDVAKLESNARRSGLFVLPSDASVPILKGAAGTVEIPVNTKDFGWWLPYMMGAVASVGPTDATYKHTGTVASLKGKSFTLQVNRKLHDSNADQAFTFEGGKVASWELKVSVDAEVSASLDLDFESVSTATALAVATYPAAMEPFSWAHPSAGLTIGGVAVPFTSFSIKCDNGLKLDRYYVRGSGLKKEPVAANYRDISWEIDGVDFDALTQYNRFNASTNGAQYAALVLGVYAPTLIGAVTYPSLVITIPSARFDSVDIDNGSNDPNVQKLAGKVRYNGAASPVTLDYVTTQVTP